MSDGTPEREVKMLPDEQTAAREVVATTPPPRQLSDMPKEELRALAEEFGLDPDEFRTPQHLVSAIHDRRQMIVAMDRESMLDVVKWGNRPVPANASKEHLAQEIARITTMRFNGLSQRGLVVLARMRGIEARDGDPIRFLVRRLKKQEGFFKRMNRRRRAMLGSLISTMIGEPEPEEDDKYQFVPPQPGASAPPAVGSASSRNIKQEIEDVGLFGGIAGRIKRSADSYVNQKLDEIEARIDRKLDEIDRRLADWRDKEVANRIRILKITLWASVIVGVCSLIYTYVNVNFISRTTTPTNQSTTK